MAWHKPGTGKGWRRGPWNSIHGRSEAGIQVRGVSEEGRGGQLVGQREGGCEVGPD